jgi:hypothetical protein
MNDVEVGGFAMHQAVTSLRASVQALSRLSVDISRLPTARAVLTLGATGAAPAQPKIDVLERARIGLLAAAREPSGIAGAARSDLKYAPWLLWGERESLATLKGLLDVVVASAHHSGAARRRLIEAWLLGFEAERPGISEAGHAIRHLLSDSADPRLDLWRSAENRFQLFDPRNARVR